MRFTRIGAFACVALVIGLCADGAGARRSRHWRHGHHGPAGDSRPLSVAVIGDAPYGGGQQENLDWLIDDVNRDEDVSIVVHLGDTKSGSTVCSDEHFEFIREAFDSFVDPLFYVPGDNEWTDCHRDNNGDYHPVERLETLR